MVCHVQDDLILRDQDVSAAVGVGTEGGVGVAWCRESDGYFSVALTFYWRFGVQCLRPAVGGLTLPDSSPVDVDLHWVCGMERLVVVEDEDVTAQGMDTGRVHCCILGKGIKDREENKYSCLYFLVSSENTSGTNCGSVCDLKSSLSWCYDNQNLG